MNTSRIHSRILAALVAFNLPLVACTTHVPPSENIPQEPAPTPLKGGDSYSAHVETEYGPLEVHGGPDSARLVIDETSYDLDLSEVIADDGELTITDTDSGFTVTLGDFSAWTTGASQNADGSLTLTFNDSNGNTSSFTVFPDAAAPPLDDSNVVARYWSDPFNEMIDQAIKDPKYAARAKKLLRPAWKVLRVLSAAAAAAIVASVAACLAAGGVPTIKVSIWNLSIDVDCKKP